MFLKTTALIALISISTLSLAADEKKSKKSFQATDKSCAKLVKLINKAAGDKKKLKKFDKRKEACLKAGF